MRMVAILVLFLSACGSEDYEVAARPDPAPAALPPGTAIVFIGDSITSGWELPPDYVNVGISGQTTPNMLDRFQRDVLDRQPRIVHILGGTNDIPFFQTVVMYSIPRMADLAQAHGACVILGTLPPRPDWSATEIDSATGDTLIEQFNAELKDVAKSFGYKIADYNTALRLADGTTDFSLFVDGVHPNSDGHERMLMVAQSQIAQCP